MKPCKTDEEEEDERAAKEAVAQAELDEEELEELGEAHANVSASTCASMKAKPTSLMRIDEAHFRAYMGSENETGETFVEIDSIAYNVSDFLSKHPGGEAALRKYAGRDASEAFHQARHSMRAKMMMQKYCVGPII